DSAFVRHRDSVCFTLADGSRSWTYGEIGTNVGPVITPWASLATLLWFESCRRHGVKVPMRRFLLTGAVLAVTALVAAVWALGAV
ncbi:ArsB/NhaD family transporter, partial [Nonomuraea sp. NPDC055795]